MIPWHALDTLEAALSERAICDIFRFPCGRRMLPYAEVERRLKARADALSHDNRHRRTEPPNDR